MPAPFVYFSWTTLTGRSSRVHIRNLDFPDMVMLCTTVPPPVDQLLAAFTARQGTAFPIDSLCQTCAEIIGIRTG